MMKKMMIRVMLLGMTAFGICGCSGTATDTYTAENVSLSGAYTLSESTAGWTRTIFFSDNNTYDAFNYPEDMEFPDMVEENQGTYEVSGSQITLSPDNGVCSSYEYTLEDGTLRMVENNYTSTFQQLSSEDAGSLISELYPNEDSQEIDAYISSYY